MKQKFITKNSKVIPMKNGRNTSGLTSKNLGVQMKSATLAEVKKINAPNGKFIGYNLKLRANESVPLENVGRTKNGAYMLKGTSPTNNITVVRIVSAKKK